MTNKIRTLITYIPINNVWMSTSLIGRVIFTLLMSVITLYILNVSPYNYFPHIMSFSILILLIISVNGHRFLFKYKILMLLLSCIFISILNIYFAPSRSFIGENNRIAYGISRGFAYASLAFSTLFIAMLTRPSDVARLISSYHATPFIICICAIPLVVFEQIAKTFKDIILVTNLKKFIFEKHSIINFFVDIAASLLATSIKRAVFLYQTASSFTTEFQSYPPKLLGTYNRIKLADMLFIIVLIPNIITLTTL